MLYFLYTNKWMPKLCIRNNKALSCCNNDKCMSKTHRFEKSSGHKVTQECLLRVLGNYCGTKDKFNEIFAFMHQCVCRLHQCVYRLCSLL